MSESERRSSAELVSGAVGPIIGPTTLQAAETSVDEAVWLRHNAVRTPCYLSRMRPGYLRASIWIASALVGATACTLLYDPDRFTGAADDASTTSPPIDASVDSESANADSSPSPDGSVCPAADGGPQLLPIARTPFFCIDATEVSAEQYTAWTSRQIADLPAGCAWKTSFRAELRLPMEPANFTDWCDAFAYCRAVGKRLCTGAELAYACTGGTSRRFPYGDVFNASACNVVEQGRDAMWPVGSQTSCQSQGTGVFDLVGNTDEWTADCDAPAMSGDAGTLCQVYGGWYKKPPAATCAYEGLQPRGSNAGFRCCAP